MRMARERIARDIRDRQAAIEKDRAVHDHLKKLRTDVD